MKQKPLVPAVEAQPAVSHPLIKTPEPAIDLVRLAFRNIIWLAIAGGVGLWLGISAYKYWGPSYVASSQILVKLKTPLPLRENADRVQVGERSAHVEIIGSPKVVERAVRDSNLGELKTLAGSGDVAQDVVEGLKVMRTAGEDHHQLNILDLQYTGPNEDDAKLIVNAVIKAYDDYLKDDALKNHRELTALLNQINGDLSPRLAKKTKEYQTFRENSPLLWKAPPGAEAGPNNVTNVHHKRVDAIAAERVKVELQYQEISSRVHTIEQAIARGESPEALLLLVKTFLQRDQQSNTQTVVNGSSDRQQLDAQLVPLMLEEQVLLQRYGSDYPDVQNVRERIRIIKEYYHKMGIRLPVADMNGKAKLDAAGQPVRSVGSDPVSTYLTAMAQQQAELKNRLDELQKLYDQSTEQAKVFSRYEAEDQTLQDELQRIKALHDMVTNRIEELSLAKDEGYQLQQISPARAELDFKRVIKIVGGIAIAVFLTAFGLIFLRDLQDTSLKSLVDLRALFRSPVLGTLPEIASSQKHLEASRQSGMAPILYYYHDPGSPAAESCRSVRSTFFVRAKEADAHIVQFTSPEPGDGKTTTISNLAISMAQAGKRVLLIDADLRRPTVHRLFGLREQIGLSESMQGEIAFENAVQNTQIDNLSILTAGAIPSKPAELLSSPRLQQILEAAKSQYDYILIDSPPILAVSDPCILAQSVDATMLVVRMNKNRRPSVKRTLELLASHEIELLGVIANGLQPTSGEYQYRGGYGGGYANRPEQPAPQQTPPARNVSILQPSDS